MFGKNKAINANSKESYTTLISSETTITGDVNFSGAVHLEGRVIGNINADSGLLTIAQTGSVQGDVRAQRVVVDGHVRGNVYAEEHLELAARAIITGNVFYNVIEMTKGSQVNGSLEYLPVGGSAHHVLLENGSTAAGGEVIEAVNN